MDEIHPLFEVDPSLPKAGGPVKPYRWLLIDGGGLATTAWATHRDLERVENRIRTAVYVMITCLASLSRLVHESAKIVVAWDGYDNRAWRRGHHPWYKHGRGTMIDRREVAVVVDQVGQLLTAMGVAMLQIPGREADDLVATLARRVEANGETCLIFSDDKDYIQLVGDNIHLARRSMDGIVMTPDQCKLMGLPFGEHALHIKAVAGDSGDNIRGLRGIGDKKAFQLLEAHPDFFEMACEDPSLVDWDDLPRSVRMAFVRAGRKITHPVPIQDKEFVLAFCSRGDQKHLQRIVDVDMACSEEAALREAAIESVRCLRLVEMDTEVPLPDPIEFPNINVERIPVLLKALDMADEHDLISSLYALARMRNPSLLPPRRAAVRAGQVIDMSPTPDDMF
jgi:5'-3' exonuclease